MNKNTTIRFEVPRARTRAHFVLFAENSPFRPKTVKNKRGTYVRKPKHPNKLED
jgi:hypothetical protein